MIKSRQITIKKSVTSTNYHWIRAGPAPVRLSSQRPLAATQVNSRAGSPPSTCHTRMCLFQFKRDQSSKAVCHRGNNGRGAHPDVADTPG